MALADDPRAFILRMFELEIREGRGQYCQVFPAGQRPAETPLDAHEQVFGIYKNKYYFTPAALLIKGQCDFTRILWSSIRSCTSRHGSGDATAKLSLVDGTTQIVAVSELATGWAGRTSQLFHGMIERLGARATLGLSLLAIEEFFARCDNDYCFAPNLSPHPTLGEIQSALITLRNQDGVEKVLVGVAEIDESTIVSDRVVIVSSLPDAAFQDFASYWKADGVVAADLETRRKAEADDATSRVWEIIWD